MQTLFFILHTANAVLKRNAYNHIRCYTHQQRFFNNNPACTYSSWNNASLTYCTILCQAKKQQRYFHILELQPTFIFTFYLWCLVVIPQPFAGTERFLAGLFTFYSRLPIASWLRTSGRNWLINSIRSRTKQIWVTGLPFSTLCWAATCGWSCMQMNSSRLKYAARNWHRQWTSKVSTHWQRSMSHTLVWLLSKFICSDNWLHSSMSEKKRMGERETT